MQTETFQGTITRTTQVTLFKVTRNPEVGGTIEFVDSKVLNQDGVSIGIEEILTYTARFDQLPATFPVVINGSTVQVSGQTILAALDAVADSVVASQS